MGDRKNITVYLFGDSITQGLGSKKVNFSGKLGELLGSSYRIVNLAQTGTTIEYGLETLRESVSENVTGDSIALILYGNVDAQIRPNRNGRVFPHIPKRYQLNGMLMPRPFYSRSLAKRIWQHVDNILRSLFAQLIRQIDGCEQWLSRDLFKARYAELLAALDQRGIQAIPCSCVYIDDALFPGCRMEYERFNQVICELARDFDLQYVDLFTLLKESVERLGWDGCYNKDHFHPNGAGYEIMARALAGEIMQASGCRRRNIRLC